MAKHAVQVRDVRKRFSYSSHKNSSIKTAITQVFKKKDKTKGTFMALDGVSFNVEKGDFFGVLGRNGSGKSTLLKIISEIYRPTSGSVKHDGKIVSFIELGVGFKTELTGRENVYLNAALLGFSKQETDEMYEDIVEFAELGKFMDQQLKNYSSGMKVRLAFSVAIRAKADILILDEVLAVGDADFQKKCTRYFQTLKNDGKTVILVTHSMSNVIRFCNKAVVIEDGKVAFEGDPNEAADRYQELFDKKETKNSEISRAETKVDLLQTDEEIEISLDMLPKEDINDFVLAIFINKNNKCVYRWVSDEDTEDEIVIKKNNRLKAKLTLQNIFSTGMYTVDVTVKSIDREISYISYLNATSFRVTNNSGYPYRNKWRPNQSFVVYDDNKSNNKQLNK